MDSISVSSSLTSRFTPPNKLPTFRQFTEKTHTKVRILSSKPLKKPPKFFPISRNLFKFCSPGASATSQCCIEEEKSLSEVSGISKGKTESIVSVSKTLVYAIFCIAVSLSPIAAFKVPAIAAPVASEVNLNRKGRIRRGEIESEVVLKPKDHEYADYTRRLLERVSNLLKTVEEVRGGNGDMEKVKSALKAVRVRKEELQDEIMSGMYKELREMKGEKEKLVKRGEKIVDEVLKVQTSINQQKGEEVRTEEPFEIIGRMERAYEEVWERVGQIEDDMLRRETVALSIGVRELCFIERECVELVSKFSREMRRNRIER